MKKFTLIELLVAVAIIGILASLLMPSLSKARAKGLTAVCLSQTKQLQYAYTMYSDDHDEYFCRNYSGGVIGTGTTKENIESTSLIFPYLGTADVFKCPADPVPASVQARHAVKSYGVNAYLNDGKSYSIQRIGEVETSLENVMGFVDEAGNVQNGFIRGNADWVGGWHLEAYNISFLDGHAKLIYLTQSVSWAAVQEMIETGHRDFGSVITNGNPDNIRRKDFQAIDR